MPRGRSGEARDLVLRRKLAPFEHPKLQRRPVRRVLVHQRARHRLDDVMDVHRHATAACDQREA